MVRSISLLLGGFFPGILLTLLVSGRPSGDSQSQRSADLSRTGIYDSLRFPLKVSLYRFKLNTANLPVYHEWVQWHHDAYLPMVATLDRERMYFESVFRDSIAEPDVIYWLAINGEGGATSATSPLDIDKKHVEYMKKILVRGSRTTLQTEFTLLPDFIEKAIGEHQQQSK